jgi:hypothetical protein
MIETIIHEIEHASEKQLFLCETKKFNTRTKGENQLNFEFLCVSESLTHPNNNKNQ